MNRSGLCPYRVKASIEKAAMADVRNIIYSRPIQSDRNPKSGRPSPFMKLLIESETIIAGPTAPRIATGVLAIPNALAIWESWAATIRPVDAIKTKAAYIAQKTGLQRVLSGGESMAA